jgi:catechol 2,3-dioxygenase-like lactoylglutathione lyase family enzyme
MKRLHVHVSVDNLAESIRFYSTLLAAQPTVRESDYAKWMLDDPRVNFAISTRGGKPGLDHLGIQVETPEELKEVYSRLQQAERPVLEEGATICCYANSEKAWTTDPQGLLWESFLTLGESTVYGDNAALTEIRAAGSRTNLEASACCGPKPSAPKGASCCETGAPK